MPLLKSTRPCYTDGAPVCSADSQQVHVEARQEITPLQPENTDMHATDN